jgi:hypothetical protein
MAIFPPQVSQADPKVPVLRPPLGKALAGELRRLAKDESGFSFIEWAITVSMVSLAVGFFIPELWALFQQVMLGVTNEMNDAAFQVKYLR